MTTSQNRSTATSSAKSKQHFLVAQWLQETGAHAEVQVTTARTTYLDGARRVAVVAGSAHLPKNGDQKCTPEAVGADAANFLSLTLRRMPDRLLCFGLR